MEVGVKLRCLRLQSLCFYLCILEGLPWISLWDVCPYAACLPTSWTVSLSGMFGGRGRQKWSCFLDSFHGAAWFTKGLEYSSEDMIAHRSTPSGMPAALQDRAPNPQPGDRGCTSPWLPPVFVLLTQTLHFPASIHPPSALCTVLRPNLPSNTRSLVPSLFYSPKHV